MLFQEPHLLTEEVQLLTPYRGYIPVKEMIVVKLLLLGHVTKDILVDGCRLTIIA